MRAPAHTMAAMLVFALSGSALAQTQTASAARPMAFGDHEVLIESIQARLDRLAQRLELAEDQVDLLQETALGSDISETRAILVHRNDLGSQFTLESVRYVLDGGVLVDRVDPGGALGDIEELVLFDGKIRSGEHLLEVEVVCRGGGFGVFSYVEAYRFKLRSRYTLKVREGRINRLEVSVSQSPDITVEPSQRLRLDYDFEIVKRARDGGATDGPEP